MRKLFHVFLIAVFCFSLINIAEGANPEKTKAYIKSLQEKQVIAKKQGESAKVKQLQALIDDAKASLLKEQGALDEDMVPDLTAPPANEAEKSSTPAVAAPKRNTAVETTTIIEEEKTPLSSSYAELVKVKPVAASQPGAKVSGQAYIFWSKDFVSGSAAPNQFDISRVYLDYKDNLDSDVAVRVTTDIARETNNTNVILKYAYFTLNDFSQHMPGLAWTGLKSIDLGQSATHWIGFMENFWQFRYVAKTLTDNYIFFNSADLGVAANGQLYLGASPINYRAIVMNGEGYKKAEANSGKDLAVNLNSRVFTLDADNYVTVAVGAMLEDVTLSSSADLTQKYTAMAAYNFKQANPGLVFVEYANQLKSSNGGYCLGGQYQVADRTNVFGRYDSFTSAGFNYVQNILGLEYSWSKNVKFAVDYQAETRNSADNFKKIYLNSLIKW